MSRANFLELRKREVQHSPVPIGQDRRRGMLYRRVLCAVKTGLFNRVLRASGRGKAEGQGAHVDLGLRSWATQLPWATPADNHGSRRRAAPDRSKRRGQGQYKGRNPAVR